MMEAATTPLEDTGVAAPPESPGGGHIAGIVESMTQLADLQVRMWLADVRRLATRILLSVVFCVLALLLTIASAVFLYASIFHILTDMLHVSTAWALLIFACVHGLAAGVLIVLALGLLRHSAGTARGSNS